MGGVKVTGESVRGVEKCEVFREVSKMYMWYEGWEESVSAILEG